MAAFRTRVTATDVAAWEADTARPNEPQLLALAQVLWCSPAELMGRPGTLREPRLFASELARRLGLPEPFHPGPRRTTAGAVTSGPARRRRANSRWTCAARPRWPVLRRGTAVDPEEVVDRFRAPLGIPPADPTAAGVWRTRARARRGTARRGGTEKLASV
ncbi:helix-turn-helix transcriptional regulator [Embleya sp. NPDC005971]|uniref:helix-turn-helix domain-containing protein n=1 Tax=Embleya sp. NPDC005971 TaxID=3156724 RepID=UPI0033FA2071